jgi:hypothetical protein|tara:strand:+ start:4470 stop:4889 length:420 start_codon:yes stop_codon:yes gene_type:complete
MEVKLLPLTERDLPFLLEVRNDISTRSYLEDNNIFNLNGCKKWFKSLTSPWYIIEVNSNRVGYFRTKGDEVGCDIHPNFRRKGYARIAYKEYLKNHNYAILKVFEDNFAKNLYLSLGFKIIGEGEVIRGRKYLKMEYNG